MIKLSNVCDIDIKQINGSGDWLFISYFNKEVEINPSAVSHSFQFDVDVFEKSINSSAPTRFFGMPLPTEYTSKYIKTYQVWCISMINGDVFYSLNKPEFEPNKAGRQYD